MARGLELGKQGARRVNKVGGEVVAPKAKKAL